MKLEEVLGQGDPSKLKELSSDELTRLFWKMKGLRKQVERDGAFWSSTNENLKVAYEKLDEQERELQRTYNIIREDLDVAEQVQRALLPKQTPEMSREFEVAVYHKQLHQVGGDYYDYFRTKDGRQAIGIFDISGHGASAALIMSFLKAQFQHVMTLVDTPKAIVERVNHASYEFLREIRRYATVNFVVFHEAGFRYVSGGGYGLLLRGGQSYTFAKIDPFIGLRQRPYQEFELPFSHGDLLALYTDGMVEAQDAGGADYSVRRLNGLIQKNKDRPVEEILRVCVDDYRGFRKADSDDITLIILRKRAK
jgi:sigma-B regulation protein RsbU (phosphoserine phosphatase)